MSRPDPFTEKEEKAGVDRTAAFSDGVFAIVITLLVLDLKLPRLPEGSSPEQLRAAIASQIPNIYVYALTFILIGSYWIGHHRKFAAMVKIDSTFLWINLTYLMAIAFLPFPSSMLGEYGNEPIVLMVYAGSNAVAGALSTAVWFYAWRRHRLIRQDIDLRLAMEGTVRTAAFACVFLITIPLALVSIYLVYALWALVIPIATAATRIYSRRYGAPSEEPGTPEDPNLT